MHSKPNNKNHARAERTSPNKADAPQGVFAPRKRPRSTLLAIVFTVIKLVVVAGILCGFIGLGLVLGIAKAYIDTTPTLDISALTESDRTSHIYDGNGNMITTFASMEFIVSYMHWKYALERSALVFALWSFTVETSFIALVICWVL